MTWWSDRTDNGHAWKVDFQAMLKEALEKSAPHREAAVKAEESAKAHAKAAKELTAQIQGLQETPGPLFRTKSEVRKEIERLSRQREGHVEAEKTQHDLARSEQAQADAVYWPIFNLDRKNPNSKDDFEHLPPEQLADDILQKELRIVEIMREIKELLGRTP